MMLFLLHLGVTCWFFGTSMVILLLPSEPWPEINVSMKKKACTHPLCFGWYLHRNVHSLRGTTKNCTSTTRNMNYTDRLDVATNQASFFSILFAIVFVVVGCNNEIQCVFQSCCCALVVVVVVVDNFLLFIHIQLHVSYVCSRVKQTPGPSHSANNQDFKQLATMATTALQQ